MIHMKIVFFTGFSSYVLFVRPGVASAAEDCSVKAANQVGAYALRNNIYIYTCSLSCVCKGHLTSCLQINGAKHDRKRCDGDKLVVEQLSKA